MIALALLVDLGSSAAGEVGAHTGPGRICIVDSAFDLLPGERVRMAGGGPEALRLEVETNRGALSYGESDIFAGAGPGRVVRSGRGWMIRRNVWQGRISYFLYVRPSRHPDMEIRPMAALFGPALTGGGSDLAILRRWNPSPHDTSCRFRYTYGWETFFEGAQPRGKREKAASPEPQPDASTLREVR